MNHIRNLNNRLKQITDSRQTFGTHQIARKWHTKTNFRELKQHGSQRWPVVKNEFIFYEQNSQLSISVLYANGSRSTLRLNISVTAISIPNRNTKNFGIIIHVPLNTQNLVISGSCITSQRQPEVQKFVQYGCYGLTSQVGLVAVNA